MKIQSLPGSLTSRRFAKCPTTTKAGDPVMIGNSAHGNGMPAVALDDYQANEGGTTFEMSGSYVLSVLASTSVSPISGQAIGFGDSIYASGGSLDAATNVYHGFTLCADSTAQLFGYYDPQENASFILSGATNTSASVKLKGSD